MLNSSSTGVTLLVMLATGAALVVMLVTPHAGMEGAMDSIRLHR